MRKIFSLFLSLILCCVVLSACGNEPAKQPCKHYYVEGICVICGEADSDYVAPCKHNYVDGVCSVCGEADPSYTVPCKHSYADGICTKCGEYDEVYCEEIYDQLKPMLFETVKAIRNHSSRISVRRNYFILSYSIIIL